MLFKKWSSEWAERISKAAGETNSYKIALIRYVFEGILSFCLSVVVLVIVAGLLDILVPALLIGLTGAVIKSFTGGLHMSTPLRCAIGGAISLVILCYVSIFIPLPAIPWIVAAFILLGLNIIVWLKAPREAKGKPLKPRQKVILGLLSKIIILLISITCLLWSKAWGVNELFYGTVFQVLNLLDLSARGMEKADDFLGKIERRPVF
jgi:accessory gene regulator B